VLLDDLVVDKHQRLCGIKCDGCGVKFSSKGHELHKCPFIKCLLCNKSILKIEYEDHCDKLHAGGDTKQPTPYSFAGALKQKMLTTTLRYFVDVPAATKGVKSLKDICTDAIGTYIDRGQYSNDSLITIYQAAVYMKIYNLASRVLRRQTQTGGFKALQCDRFLELDKEQQEEMADVAVTVRYETDGDVFDFVEFTIRRGLNRATTRLVEALDLNDMNVMCSAYRKIHGEPRYALFREWLEKIILRDTFTFMTFCECENYKLLDAKARQYLDDSHTAKLLNDRHDHMDFDEYDDMDAYAELSDCCEEDEEE
jgi:hypothetical protein